MSLLKGYLTVEELAARWGYSRGHLDNMRVLKQGPKFEKKGWFILYPIAEVKAYEKTHVIAPRRSKG